MRAMRRLTKGYHRCRKLVGFKSEWWPVFGRIEGRFHAGIRSPADLMARLFTILCRDCFSMVSDKALETGFFPPADNQTV